MSAAAVQALPADVLAARLTTVKYANVSTLVVLVLDYLLTFDLEVNHMWGHTWGSATLLLFVSRYSPFFDMGTIMYYSLARNISLTRCNQLHSVFTWLNISGIAVGEAILTLRTYALSGQKRGVMLGFAILFIISTAVGVISLARFMPTAVYTKPPLNTPGCFLADGDFVLVAIPYASALLYDIVLVGYTALFGWRRLRHSRGPLIGTLFRDGITYFIFLLVVSIINILIVVAGPPGMPGLLNSFLRVVHSIFSTRALLQVRRTAKKPPLSMSSNINLDIPLDLGLETDDRTAIVRGGRI
ncbi:hypothetical protein MIND_00939600 [Mycena indigotica]|uniref:DUF6533 domain-containing protein n=1 Tax=Mycena indigotica TaxID=2126181 RepID=A0A8H6SDQ6_9AGAR|nr:uncharacterized protein MIND_00939600 [Mycena indigotica]KAF7297068.1 hypothetical protein MIND_00939600 [Mycena indigotica]